tara:strand:- start:308601 stop:309557 length:957 start_codon:yes stop_codon:yes gene_type:complete
MEIITDLFIKENISYPELITALKKGFRDDKIQCPPKLSYDYLSAKSTQPNTALIMPAWDNTSVFGVKLITATPGNITVPYLNGLYLLFNAENGLPIAAMDAKLITNMRTAATSVLASGFLARKNASTVLIMGNGSLAPYYIEAYASLASVNKIYLWGRNLKKSQEVIRSVRVPNAIVIEAISEFRTVSKSVDIISCITSSSEALIHLEDISEGQHFDLAGSYKENMQEVSTDVVAKASVFTDNLDVTIEHAGELVQALKENKIIISDIKGDLKMLCETDDSKRVSETENTLFKCTGMALEDLVFAQLVYNKYKQTASN